MMNTKLDAITIVYEKDIKNNYMIIKNVGIDRDSYEFKVFDEIDMDNVMKYIISTEEGKIILKYDIHDYISLNEYLMLNKLKRKDLIFIINSIYSLLTSIENYLISENSILLDTKAIMIYKEKNKTIMKFCIIPCMESNFSFELSKLLVRLLRHIDTKDKNTLNLAYELFIKSSKPNYCIMDLMDVIENISRKEVIEEIDELEYINSIEKNIGYNIENQNCEEQYYAYEDVSEYNVNGNADIDINVNNEFIKTEDESINKKDIYNNHYEKVMPKKEYNLDIKIDDDTRKELNLSLFDEIDKKDNLKKQKKFFINKNKKKEKERKKLMLNANVKFHMAFFPALAIIVPIFAYFVLGVEFFTKHYMLLVFYEVVIVLIITLNSLLDAVYKQY